MKSLSVGVCLVPVLVPGLWVLVLVPGLWAGVSGAPGCGPCDPGQCVALPTAGCAAGSLLDACGCCLVCAAAEGEPCGGRGGAAAGLRAVGRRCGTGLECVRSDEDKKKKLGVCVCKSSSEVCGSDALTYSSGCALRSASLEAQTQGRQPISIRNKGRCPTAPVIVSPPGEVYNVSGSQVYLSCEAVGVPTPVLTWKKVIGGKKREGLLPGDRDNVAIQTRGGPEKHEVTGWVLVSPLTEADEGSYECRAANAIGEASAVGAIRLVNTVTKEVEL